MGKRASFGSMSNNSMPGIGEIRAVLENGDINTLLPPDESPEEDGRLSTSLLTLPTYMSSDCSFENETTTRMPTTAVVAQQETQLLAVKTESDAELPIEVKLKRKVSSLFKKRPSKSILKRPVITAEGEDVEASLGHEVKIVENHPEGGVDSSPILSNDNNNSSGTTLTMTLNHLKMRRQSLTYRGAMLNISKYRLRASSCPDIYRNSMVTIPTEELRHPVLW